MITASVMERMMAQIHEKLGSKKPDVTFTLCSFRVLVDELKKGAENAHIKELNLRCSGLDEGNCGKELSQVLKDMLMHLDGLEKLSITGTKIGDEGVNEVCIKLRAGATLRSLELARARISRDGAFLLSCAIEESRGCLEDLNVAGNRLDDEGALRLAQAATKGKLKRLNLGDVGISNDGMSKMITFLQEHNSSLCSISFNHNELRKQNGGYPSPQDELGSKIAEWLRTDNVLKELRFRVMGFSMASILLVVEALKDNFTLRDLDLPNLNLELENRCEKLLQCNASLRNCHGYFPSICSRNLKLHSMVSDAVKTVLLIRWFRTSLLSLVPKDVVKLVAKVIWKSKKQISVWIR